MINRIYHTCSCMIEVIKLVAKKTRLINSIKHEHSCKICYVNNKVFYPFWVPEKDQNRFLGYKVLEGNFIRGLNYFNIALVLQDE